MTQQVDTGNTLDTEAAVESLNNENRSKQIRFHTGNAVVYAAAANGNYRVNTMAEGVGRVLVTGVDKETVIEGIRGAKTAVMEDKDAELVEEDGGPDVLDVGSGGEVP
jgi:hypothetical protein